MRKHHSAKAQGSGEECGVGSQIHPLTQSGPLVYLPAPHPAACPWIPRAGGMPVTARG